MSIGNGPAQTLEERVAELEKKLEDLDMRSDLWFVKKWQSYVGDANGINEAVEETFVWKELIERIEKLEKWREIHQPHIIESNKLQKELSELKNAQDNLWEVKENQIAELREVLRKLSHKLELVAGYMLDQGKFDYVFDDKYWDMKKKLASGEKEADNDTTIRSGLGPLNRDRSADSKPEAGFFYKERFYPYHNPLPGMNIEEFIKNHPPKENLSEQDAPIIKAMAGFQWIHDGKMFITVEKEALIEWKQTLIRYLVKYRPAYSLRGIDLFQMAKGIKKYLGEKS